MQRFFYGLFFIFFSAFLFSSLFAPKLLTYPKETISVTLIYGEESEIYEIESFSTLSELLETIGFDKSYDKRKVNLNQILSHRDVIILPLEVENQCISINTGSIEDLISLQGIGEKVAQEIINYRNANGYFKSIDDLTLVKGIGEKKIESIRENLCL